MQDYPNVQLNFNVKRQVWHVAMALTLKLA